MNMTEQVLNLKKEIDRLIQKRANVSTDLAHYRKELGRLGKECGQLGLDINDGKTLAQLQKESQKRADDEIEALTKKIQVLKEKFL